MFSASSKYSPAAVTVRWSFITKTARPRALLNDADGFVLYLATLPVSKPAFHKLLSLTLIISAINQLNAQNLLLQ